MKQQFAFNYETFPPISCLNTPLGELAKAAKAAIELAHAPYSNFKVGAALWMADGELLTGANQENASFPAGLCAERVVLATASSQASGQAIQAIAICYESIRSGKVSDKILSPYGICRQSLLEVSDVQEVPIQVLMIAPSGRCILLNTVEHLLPLGFKANFL